MPRQDPPSLLHLPYAHVTERDGGGLGWKNKEKRKHVEIGREGVGIMVEEGVKGMSKEIEKLNKRRGEGEGGREEEGWRMTRERNGGRQFDDKPHYCLVPRPLPSLTYRKLGWSLEMRTPNIYYQFTYCR